MAHRVGGEPAASPEDRIRPPDQRRDDRLPRRRASPGRPRPRWW
jgi:hypothetical protein